MNFIIYIKNPFPFRVEECIHIQEALQKTYTRNLFYFKEYPVNWASVDGTNLTTARQIASTVKTIHLQWAISARRDGSRVNAEDVEIDIRKQGEGRPDWTNTERTMAHE